MSNENQRKNEDHRAAERRLSETIERRAAERAAEMATLPASMTKEEEEAEEAYIDRMHAAQNAAWRARGWEPFDERGEGRTEDRGRYVSGYRVYRDGSTREDFGSDR